MRKELKIILVTALLEIVWLWIIIPILPFIIKWFWYWPEWVWISFAVASAGMFVWGFILWRLSDKYWRKKILSYTVFLNFLWYAIFAVAGNIWIFLIARVISWFAWAWIWVAQAYISDISPTKERTKNMWLIWAMFWIGFILWPVIGSIFAGHSLQFLWGISAIVLLINALIVWFLLPESQKCTEEACKVESVNPIDYHHNKKQLQALFLTSFWVALWFSANQSTISLLLSDRFSVTESQMWYVFWMIWVFAVIYQVFWIKHVTRLLKEKWLVIFWITLMIFDFVAFAFNRNFLLALPLIILFPISFWSINPWVNSLVAKYAWDETGKAMWVNVSYASIANIFWPLIAGYAYTFSTWAPYLVASVFLLITLVLFLKYIKK
jgi:MFS family permease